MKQLAANYSISGAAVTLTGVNVPLSQVLLVSDATTGAVLYSMAGPAASSYTQGANSIITLATAPSSSDKLTIYYDDGVAPTNAPTVQLGSGAITSSTQRVTLASDGPEVTNSTAIKNATGTTADSSATGTTITTGSWTMVSLLKGIYNSLNAALPTGSNVVGGVTVADGSDAAQGAKADSAYAGSGSASIVAILKGIYASLVAALPAGSNVIGGVTIADGSNTSQGAKADSAANNSTSSWSIIALLKGIYALCAAATPAGSNNIGTVGVVNGGNTLAIDASGAVTTNNASLASLSYSGSGAIAINTILIGPVDCSAYRSVSVQCASLGTSGVMTPELSNDNSTWVGVTGLQTTGQTITTTLSTAVSAIFPTLGMRYFRVRLSTATTAGTMTLAVYLSQQPAPTWVVLANASLTVSLAGNSTITPVPITGSGFSSFHTLIAAGSTNATSVKATAGVIGTCFLTNNSASVRYVKFFNKTSSPTMATDTPVIQFPLQANSSVDISAAFAGMRFSSGIAYGITTGSALLDATAVTAGDVLVNLTYA